ncbi:MAG: response regulator transcription factor [Anaerolineales bacterium]|nr:response regulator transcription factor [Anaerolineales bacterium]
MIRVLIVDDHAILRDGIRSILESQEDIVVVGEASDGAEALEYVSNLLPDLVLMDISMPKTNGLEATRLIKERFPQVKVLILTQHDNREYIAPALGAGASGYVLKRSGRREMLNAIRQVHEQGTFLTSNITQEVFQEYSQAGRNGKEDEHPLTDRERQVLQLVVEGKSNKEIAMVLGISPKTVSVHRTNIMSKLDVQNTVELIRYAASNPLVSLPVPDQEIW